MLPPSSPTASDPAGNIGRSDRARSTSRWPALAALLAVPAARSCGPCPAVATDQVNLRAGPSLDAAILGVIPAGAEFQWSVEPAPVDGYVPVLYREIASWAHDGYLFLYPASATTLTAVNPRNEPGYGAPVGGILPHGASLTHLGGPRRADLFKYGYGRSRVGTRLPDLRKRHLCGIGRCVLLAIGRGIPPPRRCASD